MTQTRQRKKHATTITAKPERSAKGGSVKARQSDKRRKTPAQKAKTAAARLARAATRRRVQLWTAAAPAASAAGYPLNTALTITWAALQDGDRRRGHILDMDMVEREKRLWSELRLVAARADVEWIAARAPEHDRTRGLHLHMVLHLPDTRALRDAIGRSSGSPALRRHGLPICVAGRYAAAGGQRTALWPCRRAAGGSCNVMSRRRAVPVSHWPPTRRRAAARQRSRVNTG